MISDCTTLCNNLLRCFQVGRRLKRIRNALDDEASKHGALDSGKVVKQGMALAQKKRRLHDKKGGKPVKATAKSRRGASVGRGRKDDVEKKALTDGEEDEDDVDCDDRGGSEEEGGDEGDSEEEAQETERSRESEESNDDQSPSSKDSDDSEEYEEKSEKRSAKRKSSDAASNPNESRSKKKKDQQLFKLVLAPRSGKAALSRMATKAMEQAKSSLMDLKELRAALIAANALWKQASSASDKTSCENKFLALGQALYNCGVYSDNSVSRKGSMELLNKLVDVLRSTDTSKPSSAFLEIDRLCCDLKGKDLYT